MCSALWNVLKEKYLVEPETEEEFNCIATELMEEWNLPNVIGALDGKNVCIECPKHGGSLFYNYKSFHSTVLMAICDAKYRFIHVSIGSYGGENDAGIIKQSEFIQKFDDGSYPLPPPSQHGDYTLPHILVGDEIFPLKPWLMKPWPGKNHTLQQQVYNYQLSRSRRAPQLSATD